MIECSSISFKTEEFFAHGTMFYNTEEPVLEAIIPHIEPIRKTRFGNIEKAKVIDICLEINTDRGIFHSINYNTVIEVKEIGNPKEEPSCLYGFTITLYNNHQIIDTLIDTYKYVIEVPVSISRFNDCYYEYLPANVHIPEISKTFDDLHKLMIDAWKQHIKEMRPGLERIFPK